MAGNADELVERILSAAAELSDERIDQLVAEARREAEAEVKGLLKSSIKAALLQRALSKLGAAELASEPQKPPEAQTTRLAEEPKPELGSGCYVYGFTLGDRLTFSEPVRGIDDSAELNLVRHGDVQAVTSQVSLAEFGSAARAERGTDPKWLEQKVRAHDQLLKSALASGPVIPMRFGTVVRSDADVREVLERHYERIKETLGRLTGKKEWGVKTILRESVNAAPAEVPSGRWYLERKQNAARKETETRQQARKRALEMHEQLAAVAEASAILPVSDRAGERAVLNVAYLIGDENDRKFHARIAAMDERLEPDGLTLEVTGPWPPYNFVNLDLSLPTAP